MTREEKIAELERMLRRAPEIMSPGQVWKFSPLGKNRVYELIKNKEIRAFNYRGGYIITKADLIEYLADNSDGSNRKGFCIQRQDG